MPSVYLGGGFMTANFKFVWSLALAVGLLSFQANGQEMDEFDPQAPGAEQLLQEFDKIQEQETGMPSWIGTGFQTFSAAIMNFVSPCQRENCNIFVRVSKRNQKLYLSVSGVVQSVWPVSTGMVGHRTPDMDTHPSGRIYDRYTSTKYPGGNYKGLGNMPYAVFIRGGFAIHGTPESNWPKLGERASHGCIRVHPDNAFTFNRMVRATGIADTWITVEE